MFIDDVEDKTKDLRSLRVTELEIRGILWPLPECSLPLLSDTLKLFSDHSHIKAFQSVSKYDVEMNWEFSSQLSAYFVIYEID